MGYRFFYTARLNLPRSQVGQGVARALTLGTVSLAVGSLIACRATAIAMRPLKISLPPVSLSETALSLATAQPAQHPGYTTAVELASAAAKLGQTAQSSDDWQLIVSRWTRAVEALQTVPQSDRSYATAQTKLGEYRRNLSYAKARLTRLNNPAPLQPLPAASRAAAPPSQPLPSQSPSQSTRIPILRRHSGTPVIAVTFNGSHRYPMILDTGASRTLITRAMADELGIVPEGRVQAATASSDSVTFEIGQVDSISVADITQADVTVAIGDSVDIGLLGNDFYQAFDLVLQQQAVEFRPR
ncbi:MAG: aspartyl protease [Leptolyngbya sp. SIO4C1]|nr:aspartyl protease [Leptolyngbya sp. SIO4C1]